MTSTLHPSHRPTPILHTLLLAAACTGTPALAQDKFVELQLDTPDLIEFLRAEVVQEVWNTCSTSEGVPDIACYGEPCLLDRIDVLGGGTFRKPGTVRTVDLDNMGPINIPRLEYVQPVQAFFKRESCADDPSCSVTSYAQSPTANLIVDIYMSGTQLCAKPLRIEGDFGGVPLDGGSCVPLDLSAATRIVGGSLEHRATGLSSDLTGSRPRVAVRIEYLPDDFDTLPASVQASITTRRATAWRTYFGGQLAPSSATSSHSWRIFLSKGLLESATVARFRSILMREQDITADGPVTARWLSNGILTSAMTVEIETHVCPHTIETDVFSSFLLSVQDGDLLMNGTVTWNSDDMDVAACGALLGGVVLAPFTVPVAAVYASSFSDPEQFETSQCSATEGDDGVDMTCRLPMDVIAFTHWTSYLRLTPTGGRATADGFTISGTSIGGGPGQLSATLVQGSAACGYGVTGTCNEGPSAGYWAVAVIDGPKVCDLAVLNDPLHVYDIVGTRESQFVGLRTEVEMEFPGFQSVFCPEPGGAWSYCAEGEAPIDEFWQTPYPLHIRARTNRGSFSFAAPPPTQATQAQQDAARFGAINARVACMKLETGLFGIPGLYDPRWAVDPPYDAILWERIVGRVRDVDLGRVHVESIRVNPTDALVDRVGVLRTRNVGLMVQLDLRVTSGGRVRRTTVAVPISVDWSVSRSLVGQVGSLASRNGVSATVSLDNIVPNTSFRLELPARSIRLR